MRHLPAELSGRVFTIHLNDSDLITTLAQTGAEAVDVFHPDAVVLAHLRNTFADHPVVRVLDSVFPQEAGYSFGVLQIPVSPSFAMGTAAVCLQRLAPDGRLLIGGNPRLGGLSLLRKLAVFSAVEVFEETWDHIIYQIVEISSADVPEEWHQFWQPQPRTYHVYDRLYQVYTQPGIFSWHKIDPGPQYFLDHIREVSLPQGGTIMDAGCGYGLLGMVMRDLCQPRRTVWVDKNLMAVRCTQLGVPEGIVLAEDLVSGDFSSYEPFDVIFCVPPYYDAYTESTDFMAAFAPRTRQLLTSGGLLIIVANTVLKFHDLIKQHYDDVLNIKDGGFFEMVVAHRDD
ncbi:MAG: methyltransferase [Chloroflexi bacterium]|nr:methyltransferase [Chloroflexota bacterium]